MGSALPPARLRWQFGRQLTTDLELVRTRGKGPIHEYGLTKIFQDKEQPFGCFSDLQVKEMQW